MGAHDGRFARERKPKVNRKKISFFIVRLKKLFFTTNVLRALMGRNTKQLAFILGKFPPLSAFFGDLALSYLMIVATE